MTQRVVLVTDCNGDHETKENGLGTYEHVVSLDGGTPTRFHLCSEHEKLLDGIRLLIGQGDEIKRKYKKKEPAPEARRPGPVPSSVLIDCPEPGCTRTVKGNVGLAQHVMKTHGKTIADYR